MNLTYVLFGISALIASFQNLGYSATTFTGSFSLTNTLSASVSYDGALIPNLSVGNLTITGANFNAVSSTSGNLMASSWDIGATSGSDSFTGVVNLSEYLEFSLTAESGFLISMNAIEFNGFRRSGTGPRQFQIRSSFDNYATILSSYGPSLDSRITNSSGILTVTDLSTTTTFGSSSNKTMLNLSSAGITQVSSINFRLYDFNAESSGGTGGITGPFSFSGTIEAIPEPSASFLMIGGLVGLVGIRAIRRKSS